MGSISHGVISLTARAAKRLQTRSQSSEELVSARKKIGVYDAASFFPSDRLRSTPWEFPGGRTTVSAQLLHAPLDLATLGPASRYIRETSIELLDYETEELAALRFSIILTARWAASDDETPERRAELRQELALLRKHYGDKVDEIALTFGVQQAMKAQSQVERTVVVPRDLKPIPMKINGKDYTEEDLGL